MRAQCEHAAGVGGVGDGADAGGSGGLPAVAGTDHSCIAAKEEGCQGGEENTRHNTKHTFQGFDEYFLCEEIRAGGGEMEFVEQQRPRIKKLLHLLFLTSLVSANCAFTITSTTDVMISRLSVKKTQKVFPRSLLVG